MSQKLEDLFGVRATIVRDLDLSSYLELTKTFLAWLAKHPEVKAGNPELYIHRVAFIIEPKHFLVTGIENRLSMLRVSVSINPKQRRNKTMRFINHHIGHRLVPHIRHSFGMYENAYYIEAPQLSSASHFEEYLATVVLRRVPQRDKKVKFAMSAHATALYGSQILKNVQLPAVTNLDFRLNQEVQLRLPFDLHKAHTT